MTVLRSEGAGESSGDFYSYKINQSLRFEDGDSAYLHRTPSSASNRRTFTFSCWVKRGNLGIDTGIFQQRNDANTSQQFLLQFRSGNTLRLLDQPGSGGNSMLLDTNALFRDTSAWYHIVAAVDTTDGTAADRAKLYVNGERITSFASTTNYSTQNYDTSVNNTVRALIGVQRPNSSATLNSYFDGHIAEVNLIDGQALTPASFGETKDGIWIPKSSSGLTFGTNGFYLPFDDSSAIGDDESSNTNDWTVVNLVASDVVLDSPTNNFATFNVLEKHSASVLSEGSLVATSANPNDWEGTGSTMHVSSGKWYCEVVLTAASGTLDLIIGVARSQSFEFLAGTTFYTPDSNFGYYASVGDIYSGGSVTGDYNTTYGVGDIIGIAIDMDNLAVYFAKNNTYINSGNPASGADKTGSSGALLAGASYQVAVGAYQNNVKFTANFGQDSSFANTKTSGSAGASDANGVGDFYYAPPSGFLALCSANLPDVEIIDGTEHFNTVLWTGNETARSISGVGFSPDWVWIKSASDASGHRFYDSVRGATKGLSPENSDNEYTESGLTSFDSDGFSLGTQAGTNGDDKITVGWNWKAGGSASTIAADSISSGVPSIASSVSANTTSGFSIVSLTTPGSNTAFTFGHGLGVQPDMMIAKGRDSDGYSWIIYHRSIGAGVILVFDTTAAAGNTTFLQNTHPSSSIVSGNTTSWGANQGYIAYCFASTEGFSKAGIYTGNSDANGTFVYTGFRPAWVMLKRTTDGTYHWRMYDSKRSPFNDVDDYFSPNLSLKEKQGLNIDFLANGFKMRINNDDINDATKDYVYLAFAEQPFKFANAR